MVMTTSNVTGKIDLAFVDRADMKVFIGLPGVSAVYDILKTAVDELIRSNIILSNESPVSKNFQTFQNCIFVSEVYQCDSKGEWVRIGNETGQNCKTGSRTQWASITKDSIHCSRKIYQGKANHSSGFRTSGKCGFQSTKQVPLSKYLDAIKSAVQSELADRENMSKEVKL